MKRSTTFFLSLFCVVSIAACSRVAVTGRSQLNLVPESEVLGMSAQQYDAFLQENPASNDTRAANRVRNVGERIAEAVELYLRDHGFGQQADSFQWEFNLVENEQVNAWCMPGGKVVFYTGILPICDTDAGIAVVMGHEVAHAVARHGQERMSQELLRTVGAVAVDVATKDRSPEARSAWMTAYGLGTTVGVMLPYSRTHESEADHLGLIFMAMAGYDPHQAPTFWERMAELGGQKPPEMLSTHPSDETRIRDLNARMAEAMEYYNPR